MGRLEQKSVLIIDLVKKEKFLPSQPEARDNYTTRFRQLIYYISNEKAHVHVSIDADMSKEELIKILKKVGLN